MPAPAALAALPPACLAGAAALVALRAPGGRARLSAVRTADRPGRRSPRSGVARSRAACSLAAAGVLLLAPMPVAALVALTLLLAGPPALGRLEPAAARATRRQVEADAPLVLDLLAACLAGGASAPAATQAVARAVGGPCGERLRAVAAELAIGSSAREAWCALGGDADDPLDAAARLLSRAADGGAPIAAAVERVALDQRAALAARQRQAAARVGVLAVAPLGLCFLPAFVLVGVVPVVAGLAVAVLA